MNNSFIGKNIRQKKDIKLATNEKSFLNNVMKLNFKSSLYFSENLMGCEMGKVKIIMNKPVYQGQAIIGISKLIMYKFHYDYMKPKYYQQGQGDVTDIKLWYIDTDNFAYHIKMNDFYKDIANDI